MTRLILREVCNYRLLRERLAAEFPEADDETLRDTLEGLSDLREMTATLVRSYLDDRAFATALKQRLAEMQERLERYEHRAARKRELTREVMEYADLRKLTEPDFTVSLAAKQPGVIIQDEGAIPADYWVPQPAKLDRQGLKTALKAGAAVPGAQLDNGGTTVMVRTK